MGNFEAFQSGSMTYEEVREELADNRLVVVGISWKNNRTGHIIVISGIRYSYKQGVEKPECFIVWDPQTQQHKKDVLLETLTNGLYRGSGTWTDTYLVTE